MKGIVNNMKVEWQLEQLPDALMGQTALTYSVESRFLIRR